LYPWSTQNEIEWKENYQPLGWRCASTRQEPRSAASLHRHVRASSINLVFGYIRRLSSLAGCPASNPSKSYARPRRRRALCAPAGRAGARFGCGKYADLLVHDHKPTDRLSSCHWNGARCASTMATNRSVVTSSPQIHIRGRAGASTAAELLSDVRDLVQGNLVLKRHPPRLMPSH